MTAQGCDLVRQSGDDWYIQGDLLESYFGDHPNRQPERTIFSTALYRGYFANWVIRGRRIYLTGLYVLSYDRIENTFGHKACSLRAAFPDRPKPVRADWYTGPAILAGGEMLVYVHAGFSSHYARYRLLSIRGGMIESDIPVSGDQYQARREDHRAVNGWRWDRGHMESYRIVPRAYRNMRQVDWSDLLDGRGTRPRPAWSGAGQPVGTGIGKAVRHARRRTAPA